MLSTAPTVADFTAATKTIEGSAGAMTVHTYRHSGAAAGTALMLHGRNGGAAQPHMLPIIDACLERSLVVVAPDLCHSSANHSAGASHTFTMAAHVSDARAALDLARAAASLPPGAPLVLIGHSMGSYAALRLAAEAPAGTIAGVIAVSPVVSGRALIAARRTMGADAIATLEAELPGALTEWPRHDLAPLPATFDVPCAIVVGAADTLTSPRDAEALAALLGGNCVSLDVVPGAHHCPLGKDYERSLGAALDRLLAGGDRLLPEGDRHPPEGDRHLPGADRLSPSAGSVLPRGAPLRPRSSR